MYRCIDCNEEAEDCKGWYAEYLPKGNTQSECSPTSKVMRCPECGKTERDMRENMLNSVPVEGVDKKHRIAYAKYLRKHGISGWRTKLTAPPA